MREMKLVVQKRRPRQAGEQRLSDGWTDDPRSWASNRNNLATATMVVEGMDAGSLLNS